MKVINDIKDFKLTGKSVVAIGVFDGVHKAHRQIISAAVKSARVWKARSVVLTFWPHPQGQASLNSLAYRLRLIEELGVDVCVVIRFTRRFAGIRANDFVKGVLVDRLRAGAVFIGGNFRFGKNAEGNVRLLKKLSRFYGFQVRSFKVFKTGNAAISSTLIRKLISSGKLRPAEKILMRPVSVLGTVIKGASLATQLGFPTANIAAHHEVLPPAGIYAVQVFFDKQNYPAICYIGKRPTFSGNNQNIEVHIFDFKKNIYGIDLEIQFIRKIRKEKKFSDPLALIKQIKKDIIEARNILSAYHSCPPKS
ncbi:MAG: riboflavin biosynthesis protein RibF [Candidatus Omnitrophica bacterium]|nr:riboflavin biosynthesis protein RibF [Candidatus Omnitrophota bacterium]